VAVGKTRAMDVVTGESSGSSGQLLLLYPLLFREWLLCGFIAFIAYVLVGIACLQDLMWVCAANVHARCWCLVDAVTGCVQQVAGLAGSYSA
jgi:hypothetical protein